MFRRVILIVLDGVGIGAAPDATLYGDQNAATLQHVAAAVGGLDLPHLEQLGLGNIARIEGVAEVRHPTAWWGKMREQNPGKDSVTGHWELAGVFLDRAFATFPEGFPADIIAQFHQATGLLPLGNTVASGTAILRELGEQHLRTGRPILYTSSDSVFQLAAHEDVIAPEKLYAICRQAEKIVRPYNVCRVIARPFRGTAADNFYRTAGRHDFPVRPPVKTLLDLLREHSIPTCGIGKIHDLYAGQGLSEALPSRNNSEGMSLIISALGKINYGLVMTNLVDFDMLYGHRLDTAGFAGALAQFDAWLPELFKCMRAEDLLLITADHGCDPTTPGTDHTREYVPLLVYRKLCCGRTGKSLGIRRSFADVGATVAENFTLSLPSGQSFLAAIV